MADADPPPPLGYLQRLELRRIETSAGIVPGSVVMNVDEDGLERVSFDLRTETTVVPPREDVRDVERVHLVYGFRRRFGETAPTWVACDRADFPREVGHLCAGPPGCPAIPCLSLGGMQPLYERGGIEVIMERLRDFMRDAKTGTLMADGWEPVPFAVDQTFTHGEIEPHRFQEHAAANPSGGHAVGTAIHISHDHGEHVILHPEIVQPDKLRHALGQRNGAGREEGYTAVPWLFLWPPANRVETAPVFQAWRTQAELREGLGRLGVEQAYDAALGCMRLADVSFKVKRPPTGGQSFAVILGVWRPSPIMKAFFGYSEDLSARRLELRAFLVSQETGRDMLTDDAKVEAIVGSYPPRPELMRWVSGVERVPAVALLGAGALGSAILENLVRAGADDLFVQDEDALAPHNLARHSGRLRNVHQPKVAQARQLVETVVQTGSAQIETSADDIAETESETLKARTAGRLVIDATADERVRLRMDELRRAGDETIVRTELFHEGRLGATFVSRAGGPTPSELALALIAAAVDAAPVAAWLEHEAHHPLGPDPMLYGFGCASQTVHLPNFVVEQQAGVAMTAILDANSTSGTLINPLDERFRPLGTTWLPVPPFASLVPPTRQDWTIRMARGALDRMADERARALPVETGGYLYGSWDPARRTITIIVATPSPPGTRADASTLELAPAGRTPEERRLLRRTRKRIHLCGTWHSHGGRSARMSGRDHRAMVRHREADAPTLRPTLMVIVADGEVEAHLEVP